jgi:singapore isolate B (sub-type 7) whole genome shotgun sequence assembly, scaffold_17
MLLSSFDSSKGTIVPYVSKQFPENSTKSLPGDLPFFITPDYNEIKPLSVYEPYLFGLVLRDSIDRNTLLSLLETMESVCMDSVVVIFLKVLEVDTMWVRDSLK